MTHRGFPTLGPLSDKMRDCPSGSLPRPGWRHHPALGRPVVDAERWSVASRCEWPGTSSINPQCPDHTWQGRNMHVSNRLEVKLTGLERCSSCSSLHQRADKGLAPVCLLSHRPLLLSRCTCLSLHIVLMLWMLGCKTQQPLWLQLVCTQHPEGAALPELLLFGADTAACRHRWPRLEKQGNKG